MLKILSAVLAMALSSNCLLADQKGTQLNTGSFSELVYEAGNTYGYKIIVYRCSGLWAVFHDADTQLPIVVPVSSKGDCIEFTVPNDIEAGRKRTFRGKITKTHLVGKFDNSDSIIKLCRGRL